MVDNIDKIISNIVKVNDITNFTDEIEVDAALLKKTSKKVEVMRCLMM